MAIRLKPKRFGPVLVFFREGAEISFSSSINDPGQVYPPFEKPVLTLMASVGHCLVESIRNVAQRKGYDLSPFAISVEAEKSTDLPARLQTMRCQVHGELISPAEIADKVISQAKSICTVSNTLGCEISVGKSRD